ncbi:MAG: DUF4830 domain-containing protein [Clostridia bacterium]|nr:DUF4830 domain-containing protein [Clostridia bacterium]
MFVYSVKTSKAKIGALLLAIGAVVIAVVMTLTGSKTPAANDGALNVKAENSAERTAFLSQYGWNVSSDPVEVSEVIIPEDFDAGYSEYASMNKAAGFDLEPYKGMRAKRWTYDVLNYPGLENTKGIVQANLLVFEGRVIGGDVCSLESGGFIHSFEMPENVVPQTTAQPESAVEVTSLTRN